MSRTLVKTRCQNDSQFIMPYPSRRFRLPHSVGSLPRSLRMQVVFDGSVPSRLVFYTF